MINIKAETKLYKDSMIVTLNAAGHADYAKEGPDIVCAAVSTLLQTFAAYCEEMELEMEVKSFESGNLSIVVSGKLSELSKPFLMTKTGLEMISETYPDNVRFLWGETEKDLLIY